MHCKLVIFTLNVTKHSIMLKNVLHVIIYKLTGFKSNIAFDMTESTRYRIR